MLDQLARCYEGCRSFADFLGLNVVRHGRRPAPEDSFQYVRRHTCGRPRDLVAIASAISSKRSSLNEKRLRDIVQQTSSTVLVSNIFDEMRVFLNCLDDRDAAWPVPGGDPAQHPGKVRSDSRLRKFNGLEPGTLAHFGEDSERHLPSVSRSCISRACWASSSAIPKRALTIQRFRRPHDSLSRSATELPDSPVFLIHPALDTFIRAQRTSFLQFQHIPVGENLVWHPYFLTILQIERQLQKIKDRQVSDLVHQVVRRVQALLNTGQTRFARLEIETSPDYKTLREKAEDEAGGEILLWLDELLREL